MRNLNRAAAILVIGLLYSCTTVSITDPVNPDASPEARELLSFLYSIRGEHIVSGQHNYRRGILQSTDSIEAITGKVPALWGVDIAAIDSGKDVRYWDVDRSLLNKAKLDEAIRQYRKGAIVTMMYHQVKPFNHDSLGFSGSVKGMVSDEEWEQIITPGTKYHTMLLEKIDIRAEWLKILKEAGVPVLWRPYHEMNGMWFWWGNRPGENGYQKLWKIMYDRYVNYHKLNNLIWVWNPNAPRDKKGNEAYDYHLFYPGAEYVDILAADIYGKEKEYKQSHHDDLLKLADGKIIAIGECGMAPTPEILDRQPEWTWFMIWAGLNYSPKWNTYEHLCEIYSDERVLTLDEMKDFK